jgi:tungstate transport system ATP-binding protein
VRYGDQVALDIPRLKITAGEVLCVLGPNGAGKTTLLKVMGCLQAPSKGSVRLEGQAVSPANALSVRRRIATVFQEALLLNGTVYQNASLGLKLRGLDGAEIAHRLAPWLDRLGIAHLANRSARTLSGGEAQRTSLARAFALSPRILLLDEPFAALDPGSREELLRDFQRIIRDEGMTTVFVTHDREEAFTVADKVGVMVGGRMAQLGSREEVFGRPCSHAVAEIVGVENCLSGLVQQGEGGVLGILIGKAMLPLSRQLPRGARVVACLRAEDIELGPPNCRNADRITLSGRVIQVWPGLARYRVAVDCDGFTLIALADKKQAETISRGDLAAAHFSAAAIHLIAAGKD